MIDEVRSEHARRRREQDHAAATAPLEQPQEPGLDRDDSLALLFLCCHPSMSGPSQVALTLRAVGGLSTAQIAAAFLVPEATMAQRISRAKQAIRASGARFEMPGPAKRMARLSIVLHVLYLIFNEGYTATAGSGLTVPQLSGEAIRPPGARRPARRRASGGLVPLGTPA